MTNIDYADVQAKPKLGAELFALLNAKQDVGTLTPLRYGVPGLSVEKIKDIENALGFKLPEDFVYLLKNIQDPGGVLFPWSKFEKKEYDDLIAWVWGGIQFDIENGALWLPRWKDKPADLSLALQIAEKDFATWPKLLPIYGHRFLAAEPCRNGNPVFSIMQSDIIYYGADLAHYLVKEFIDNDWNLHVHAQSISRVDVWSDFAEGLYLKELAATK